MHIIDAAWTPQVNYLLVWCPCGLSNWHRADRWTVACPCGRKENLHDIRQRFVDRHNPV